jgi:hypothetical protein
MGSSLKLRTGLRKGESVQGGWSNLARHLVCNEKTASSNLAPSTAHKIIPHCPNNMEDTGETYEGFSVYRKQVGDRTRRVIKKPCEYCGEEDITRICDLKQGWGKYCSRKCSSKHRMEKKDQTGEDNPNWKGGVSENAYRYKKKQVNKYPKKERARKKVYDAIRFENLVRKPCEVCGEEKAQAHHEDYDKPLEVNWLCRKHHREYHKSEYDSVEEFKRYYDT